MDLHVSLLKKIIICVFVYITFMVILFPARVALSFAPIPKNVVVSGVDGTIWNGHIENIAIGQRVLDDVSWKIKPWGFLAGKLSLDLKVGNRAKDVNGKGLIDITTSGINASKLRFEIPTNFIMGQTRLPFQTKVFGSLNLIVPEYTHGKPWCDTLNGKIFLDKIAVKNQFGNFPLGDITFGLSCQKGDVKLIANEAENQIGLKGQVILKAANKIEVKAFIRESDKQPADLKQIFQFLGKPNAEGYYPLVYSGVIPKL